jgi:sec-independent protein translocase protein TatA
MPDIGIPELLIILVIVLIVFGPGRLSGAGTAMGQAIREFRRGVRGKEEEAKLPQPDAGASEVTDAPVEFDPEGGKRSLK